MNNHYRLYLRTTLLWCIALLVGSTMLLAQRKPVPVVTDPGTKGEIQALPEKNSLKLIYPAGNAFIYVFKDSTKVTRRYSDSSTMTYVREVTYYMSQKAPKDPENGILDVDVNIDSMDYRFSSGDVTMQYNSQRTKDMQLKFPDLVAATVPVNRTFRMTYSPYWEVVKTEGEQLDWLRNYIEENNNGQLDSMMLWVWLNGISMTNLAQVGDLEKGVLPDKRIHRDSSWRKPFFIKADGVDCRDDSARSVIKGFHDNAYVIETTISHLTPTKEPLRLYGIPYLVRVVDGKGTGKYTINLSKKGVINSAEADITTVMKAKVKNENFTQTVRSKYSWQILGQYQY